MGKNLEIHLGSNYQIVVEKEIDKIKQSPFINVYRKAFELVDEIIINSKNYIQNENHEDIEIPYTYNNVIAFTGDRGIGKTSAMISFANMLSKGISLKDGGNNIKEKCYITKVIDPSLFNHNSNIMEVVISHLFSHMINELKKDNCRVKESEKSATISAFEEVFKNIKTTLKSKTEIYNGDSVEVLIDLANASSMQNSVGNLVNEFLKFVNKDYLVIQIDDIDLHTQQAHEMAEMIRKYLTQPNVIVLMALNPEQLEEVVYQQFLNDYKNILSIYGSGSLEKKQKTAELRSMTARYMEKFLPADRRIFLPTLYELSLESSIILKKNNQIYCARSSVAELLMELIYTKTGVVTFETEALAYQFLPKNLRELIYEIEKLCNMKTIVYTSFVLNLRIRLKLELDINSISYKSIVNEDGIAIWNSSITEGVDKNIINELENTDKSMDLLGLLKLRKEKKAYWEEDLDEISGLVKIEKKGKITTLFGKSNPFSLFNYDKLFGQESVKTKDEQVKLSNEYDGFVSFITKVLEFDEKQIDDLKMQQLYEFKHIFYGWTKDNLEFEDFNIITEFFEIAAEGKNQFIVYQLAKKIDAVLEFYKYEAGEITAENEIYSSDGPSSTDMEFDLKTLDYEEYRRIKNQSNNGKNISFGDVNYILNVYRQCYVNNKAIKLIYAIKLSYNLQILEYNYMNMLSANKSILLLLGGSLYNGVTQSVIKSRRVDNSYENEFQAFVNVTRNFLLTEGENRECFNFLIKDFEPSPKIREYYKNSSDLKALPVYMDKYRALESTYYLLREESKIRKLYLYDIWGFLFNLHRVVDFVQSNWIENEEYIDDLRFDYQQLSNMLAMNQMKDYGNIIKLENFNTKSEFIYYASYLNNLRSLVIFDYSKIFYNNFRYLNYLKIFRDIEKSMIESLALSDQMFKQVVDSYLFIDDSFDAEIRKLISKNIKKDSKEISEFIDYAQKIIIGLINYDKKYNGGSVSLLNEKMAKNNIKNSTKLNTLINLNIRKKEYSGRLYEWSKDLDLRLRGVAMLFVTIDLIYEIVDDKSMLRSLIIEDLGLYKNE